MTDSTPNTCDSHTTAKTAGNDDWLVVFILFALAAFLAFSYFDGRVAKAVKSTYVWMTPATAVVLILMTVACLWNLLYRKGTSCHCHGDSSPRRGRLLCVVILLAPMVFSLVVNPRALSLEGSRKRRTPAPSFNSEFQQAVAWVLGEDPSSNMPQKNSVPLPPNPNVLDVFAAAGGSGAAELDGRFVTLEGQCDLYGGPDAQQFDLYRLVVSCCIADASSVALEVSRPANVPLEAGTWIRAAGILKIESRSGFTVPVLHATTISRIPEPSSPYL